MAAVISGNGLGLFGNSAAQWGGASVGQGGLSQYVNIATGNLLLQTVDEHLVFRGLSVGQARTYNSLGGLGQVGSDAWLTGFERRVEVLSGTLNSAGSVVRRHTGDGAYQDFVFSATNIYVATSGDGAHDTLTLDAASQGWTWCEGSTRREEDYGDLASAGGRLLAIRDARSDAGTPTQWTVVYDAADRIVEIRAGGANGDALLFSYDAGGRVASLSTRENGAVRSQVAYTYDALGRLSTVATDLTPYDATDNQVLANNDGRLFVTTYTYVGTTLQLAKVAQGDGTLVSYTYHADGRLKSITNGDANANDGDGIGETLTYAYAEGSTSVSDSLGRTWTYGYDAQGQLLTITAPAIDGLSDVTSYAYDADGNLVQARTARGSDVLSLVDYRHDADGNLLWQWDGLGNAISRTYSATNQLLTETRYSGVDPDRTGAALPSGGMTTRFIHDVSDRLAFVVDAVGGVTRYEYAASGNGIGQQSAQRRYLAAYAGTVDLAALQAWADGQRGNSTLTEYGYDLWGRLSHATAYAAVDAAGQGVFDAAAELTRYSHDAQGLLRQRIAVRNVGRTPSGAVLAGSQVTDYVYDGMGRLLGTLQRASERTGWVANPGAAAITPPDADAMTAYLAQAANDAGTISTTYRYLDATHTLAVSLDSGAIRTEVRNAAGRLVSETLSQAGGGAVARTTQYFHDSAGQLRAMQDASGARSYRFYDARGRLQATVDGTGAVVEMSYDALDRLVQTRQYANRVTTTAWLSGTAVTKGTFAEIGVVPDAANDRIQSREYDDAGRLSRETGPAGLVTTYGYDGAGRQVWVERSDAADPQATRRTRSFHDANGRVLATLDAEGFLVETHYDALGRVASVIRYATATPTAYRLAGTLAQLRPAANAADQVTRNFHDGRGRLAGVLDAEGYLTEWTLDEAGNARAERRHAVAVAWQSGDTLATIRARAGAYRETRSAYNGLGQLATVVDHQGTVTRHAYDEAGRLVRTTTADGVATEVRDDYRRYNAFGELIGEISGEGAEKARTLLLGGKALNDPSLTAAQLDAAYAAHGVRHAYDPLGRRIESIDADGNRTWYFHNDVLGRAYTIRGVAEDDQGASHARNAYGEVSESRLNAFGEVVETIAYTGRLAITDASRSGLEALIDTLSYVASVDSRRQFTYDTAGRLASLRNAENALSRYTYNAFGDRIREESAVGTAVAAVAESAYDHRGLLTSRTEAVGTTVQRQTSQAHDAFRRVVSATDARGSQVTYAYDRLGRELSHGQVVLGRAETWRTTYNAFDQVLTRIDPQQRTTTYAYDVAARSMVVTTPEGVVVTTLYDRHGQSVSVRQALPDGTIAETRYAYDRDGRLTGTTNPLGDTSTSQYDKRGLLVATVGADGRRVELRYDAAGRVLARIEDPQGLALTTAYTYDAQGRQLTVTDPDGRVARHTYDREGRLKQTAVDPAGLNLRTTYSYDAQGREVTRTEGAGTTAAKAVAFAYDALGRRIRETVDPGTGRLNLVTEYAYDANDNVVRRTDAEGSVTRFYYDEANRLLYTVDALGAITRNWYDQSGRMVATRTFGQALDTSQLTDATTNAQLAAMLNWSTSIPYRGDYRIYNEDGQLRFVLSNAGSLVENVYDSAGRLVAVKRYAALAWPALGTTTTALFAGTATEADIDVSAIANSVFDEVTYRVHDAAGQLLMTVDGLGNVEKWQYDAAGRQVGYKRHADLADIAALRASLEAGTASKADVMASSTTSNTLDPGEYSVFDGAGRLVFTVGASGSVVETSWDAAGHPAASRAYIRPIAISYDLRVKLTSGDPTAAQDIRALLVPLADDARDARSYQVRDEAGRVRMSIDAGGFVTTYTYDAAGRIVEERRQVHAATLTAGLRTKLQAGTATLAEVTATTTQNAYDRRSFNVYDAAGRVRYVLVQDSTTTCTVLERRYDAMGRVVEDIAYGITVPLAASWTLAGVAAQLGASGATDAGNHRRTRFVHDADGNLRFTIDDLGFVTEQRFDGLGRATQALVYGQPVPAGTGANEAALVDALAAIGDVRVTTTAYDGAGRVRSVTDALNHTETFAYDAIGRRTAHTDKLGRTWLYEYDADGRMVKETSPRVDVATITEAGEVTVTLRSIITRIGYDAFGNVVSRTENADSPQARTVQYLYDQRGLQIATIFPDAGAIDATGQLVSTGGSPQSTVTYDGLGRAVVNQDVRGGYSYRVYDTLGRLAYEVDQEGYVTAYGYNPFGEQNSLRRYANPINTAAIGGGWTVGSAITEAQIEAVGVLATHSTDRTLTTAWDQRGNKLSVRQSQVAYLNQAGTSATGTPTTQFQYDAFGNLVKESILLEGTVGQANAVWADTWHYYDELGRRTGTVDAEGHVTAWEYGAQGEVLLQVEYARAINTSGLPTASVPQPAAGDASTGYDRFTEFGYDALGRKTSETVSRLYQRADGSAGMRDVTTSFEYDHEDRLTRTLVDGVMTSTLQYDALGRSTSLTEAARDVLVSGWQTSVMNSSAVDLSSESLFVSTSPYTSMQYDAFGNVVRVIRYAKGKPVGGSVDAADANNQVTTTFYDLQGRAVINRDAAGTVNYSRYDAADNLVESWYELTTGEGSVATVRSVASYDGVGRQETMVVTRGAATDSSTAVRYNAFGEIVAQGSTLDDLLVASRAAQYTYDAAGRVTKATAETGTFRRYGYNLAGHQLREERDWTDGTTARTAVYSQSVDKLGRVVGRTLPAHSADATNLAHASTRYDRWGNVLEEVDARGFVTRYSYNDRNQLIRQVAPLVQVLSEAGVSSWTRPETRWMYDALGRLTAMRDANGNVDRFEYDAAGQLVRSIDALGAATRKGYDGLGRAVASQDPLGYITFANFDKLDRVTAQGDFLLNAAGTARTRTTLQSFTLNQRGDRLKVTDATGRWTAYEYDSRSLLLNSETEEGVVHAYAYDAQGRKTSDVDGIGGSNTWSYDYFGRLTGHNDLGNADYTYTYDARSGLLVGTTSSRTVTAPAPGGRDPWKWDETGTVDPIVLTEQMLDRRIEYYANGQVRRISDGDIFHQYEYDAAGNRTVEETKTVDGRGMTVHVRTCISYDSHNRIARVTTDDLVTGKRTLDLSYDYDAVGNRRRVVANSGYGDNIAPLSQANIAPVLVDEPASQSLKAGVAVEWRIRASDVFRDPEGTALSYGLTLGSGSAIPAWLDMDYDAATGELVFKATTGSSAALGQTLTLKLTATDSANGQVTGGLSTSANFTLKVAGNSAPQLVPSATTTIYAKIGDVFAREFQVGEYFLDPDIGDVLSLSLDDISATLPWLTVDTSTPGVVRVHGTPSQAGSYSLRLRARDSSGAEATRVVTLTVAAKKPPVAVSVPPLSLVAGRDFSIDKLLSELFTDPNGDDGLVVVATLPDGKALPSWITATFLSEQEPPVLRLAGNPPAGVTSLAIKLTATDSDGMSASSTLSLTVTANTAPVLLASVPAQQARVGTAYAETFSFATLFDDPQNDALVYSMSTSDSRMHWLSYTTNASQGTFTLSGTPPVTSQNDDYTVTIRATDIDGLSKDLVIAFHVKGANPPTFNAGSLPNKTVPFGDAWTYQIPAGAFSEPDGDPITYYVDQLVMVDHGWFDEELGKYIHDWVEEAQPRPTWLNFNASTRTLSGTPPEAETIKLRVRATDANGTAYGTFSLTAANYGPTLAKAIPAQTAAPGVNWSFAIPAGTFADANNEQLTYSKVAGPGWLSVSSGGAFSGVPTTAGSWTVTVRAKDASGLYKDASFTVTTPNVGPVLVTAIPNQVAPAGSSWSYTFPAGTFKDANNDPLIYSATGRPAWMQFDPATRRFSGTPTGVGSWTITVTAEDSVSGLTKTDSFVVTTPNAGPTLINAIPDQQPAPGTAWSYAIPSNTFSDPNGSSDTLTYSVTSTLPGWLAFNASTRTFSGTPLAAGTWTVNVTAKDEAGLSVTDSFKVTVPDLRPYVAAPVPNQTAAASVAWSYTLPAGTFVDPNNDPLGYTAFVERRERVYDPVDDVHYFEFYYDPLPSWLSFNASTRKFTGTPPTPQSLVLAVYATDGGVPVMDTFALTVSEAPNYAPVVANAIPNQTATATGGTWSYAFPSNTFSDPNGDALTYTATGMPTWMGFNATTRTFSGVPAAIGSWTINVTAHDPDGATRTESFVVTTPNAAPKLVAPIANKSISTGVAWSYTIPAGTFDDPNNQALTYSVAGRPSWMAWNATTRTLSGTPTAGTWSLTVTASDGSLSASDSFTVTASTAVNQPPTVNRPLVNQYGDIVSYTFAADTFVDPNGDALTYSFTMSPLGSLSFDPATRHFSGTLMGGKYGKLYTVTVTASDGRGGSVSDSFTIDVPGYMDPYAFAAGDGSGGSSLRGARAASLRQLEEDTASQTQMVIADPDPEDPGDPGGGTGGTGGGTTPTGVNRQELWFTYDAENRVQVVNGTLTSGEILVSGDKSYALQYDAAGRATSRLTEEEGVKLVAQSTWTARGELATEYFAAEAGEFAGVQARHTYDAAGRETESRSYFKLGTTRTYRTGNPNYPETEWYTVDIGGWLASSNQTTYDRDGRVLGVDERGRYGAWVGGAGGGDGSMSTTEVAHQTNDLSALTLLSRVRYTAADGVTSGYDAAGRLKTYSYERLANATGAFTHRYTYGYEARDTYLEKSISGTSSNTNYKATTSTSTYDPTGRRVAVQETTPLDGQVLTRLRYFSYDAAGGILTRRDGRLENGTFIQTGSRQHYAYANGQQVAHLGEDGEMDVSTQLTAFDSSSTGSSEPALVLEGDTLRTIAQRVYGNGSLWYVLAEANAVTDADLVAGTTLKAPAVKTTTNDAGTFKPFDPSEIIGPTTPSLPYISPPPKQQCDALMTILIVVVVIVVTVATAGAAASAMATGGTAAGTTAGAAGAGVTGSVAAGGATAGTTAGVMSTGATLMSGGAVAGLTTGQAIGAVFAGGMTGNLAGQVAGNAMGVRDGYSLREAFAGGFTAVAGAGIAGMLGGGATKPFGVLDKPANAAASAVLNSLAGTVANRLVGLDTKFSWRNVAASAVTAAITSAVAGKLTARFEGDLSAGAEFARSLIGNAVGGVVGLHVRRAFGSGEAVNYGQVAADAFGNALGNAFVASRNRPVPQPAESPFSAGNAVKALDSYTSAEQAGFWGAKSAVSDGQPSLGGLQVMRGERYANNPDYEYMPSQGGYVRRNLLKKFTEGVHAWSVAYHELYPTLPTIESYIAAGSETDLYAAYFAYNDEISQPFTEFQKEFNSDPARVEAARSVFLEQLAANARLAEMVSPSPTPFTVEGYDAFRRQLAASDWQATKDFLWGMAEGTANSAVLFLQEATDSQPFVVKDGRLTHKTTEDYWLPFSDVPSSAAQAAGRIIGPFAAGAIPLGAASELSAVSRASSGSLHVADSARLNVLEGSGSAIRLDGHKVYDPAFSPLSTNPSAQYRFSDPTFRSTGSDVYFGENLATSYFEVRKSVSGKSLFVGDLRLENMLDLTDANVLKRMNIDQGRLMARVDSPLDQKAVYGYTNQISNDAFAAGYNGIIYQSTRGPGNAVVLFGGRYDPKMIVPIIDVPLP